MIRAAAPLRRRARPDVRHRLRRDDQVGPDETVLHTWDELGVPVELAGEQNWWDNGPTGPGGPDSEIFVWTGDGTPQGTPGTDDRWMEVWNHVQMRYHRHQDGRLTPLRQPSVDHRHGPRAPRDGGAPPPVGLETAVHEQPLPRGQARDWQTRAHREVDIARQRCEVTSFNGNYSANVPSRFQSVRPNTR